MDPRWKPSHNAWLVALTVTLATFMKCWTPPSPTWPCRISPEASRRASTRAPGADLVSGGQRHRPSAFRMVSSLIGRKNYYMASVAVFTASSFSVDCASLGWLLSSGFFRDSAERGFSPASNPFWRTPSPPKSWEWHGALRLCGGDSAR